MRSFLLFWWKIFRSKRGRYGNELKQTKLWKSFNGHRNKHAKFYERTLQNIAGFVSIHSPFKTSVGLKNRQRTIKLSIEDFCKAAKRPILLKIHQNLNKSKVVQRSHRKILQCQTPTHKNQKKKNFSSTNVGTVCQSRSSWCESSNCWLLNKRKLFLFSFLELLRHIIIVKRSDEFGKV